MNYLYKIKGEEVILSKEEHEKIKEAQLSGIDIVYLRNDTLGINPKRVDIFRKTNEPTIPQEEERLNQLCLPIQEQKSNISDKKAVEIRSAIKSFGSSLKNKDDGWKNCIVCKNDHFISTANNTCLGCIGKNILSVK